MTTETIALHYPFYPSKDNEDYVTYFIDKIQGEILHVKLSEMISDIDKVGNPMIIDLPEKYTLLTEWYNPIFPLSYKKSELYEKSKYITYVVEVIDKKGSYFHRISYATKPFPTSEEVLLNKRQPIPVYIVSNRDKAMNCVFIQDIDMSSISNVDTKR
ncbi:MAG: hypothetical protein IPP60_05965 [Sphingobacteriales bacterium]|nr:hypothetical protein [Sphingobacteriales bacterium]